MNLNFSFKVAKSPDLEKEIQQHLQKLRKRLSVYRPELVNLHGALDHGPHESFVVNLNLRLPSGQLSVLSSGSSAGAVMKVAFADLVGQVSRHTELLRNEHKWRRQKRRGPELHMPAVDEGDAVTTLALPLELPESLTATSLAPRKTNGKSSPAELTEAAFADENRPNVQADVRSYINANLPRLERFVARELRYIEATDPGGATPVSVNEIIDEVVVTALSADHRPPQLVLERWLYRLAIQAIKRVAAGETDFDSVPLEEHVGTQNVTGSDEDFMQFHQPGETMNRENVIADVRAGNPEELAASDELIDQLETALHGVTREQREAFVLYAIEGFTVDEIVQVTDHPMEQVRGAIEDARQHLGRKLPAGHKLKKKLLQHSSVA